MNLTQKRWLWASLDSVLIKQKGSEAAREQSAELVQMGIPDAGRRIAD
jgi:hypothetical protein